MVSGLIVLVVMKRLAAMTELVATTSWRDNMHTAQFGG